MGALVYKRFPVDGNLYGRRVVFMYGTAEQIEKRFKWNHPHASDHPTFHPCGQAKYVQWEYHDGSQTDYICLIRRPKQRRIDEDAALMHEVIHHAIDVMDRASVKITAENDEPLTYYAQWMFAQCLAVIR